MGPLNNLLSFDGEVSTPTALLISTIHFYEAYPVFKSASFTFNFATASLASPIRC